MCNETLQQIIIPTLIILHMQSIYTYNNAIKILGADENRKVLLIKYSLSNNY